MSLNQNNNINLGQMKPAHNASITYHGHPTDQIISCLQKSIRRSLEEETLYAALEMDLYALIYQLPPGQVLYTTQKGKDVTASEAIRSVKSRRTNLVNRLLVTAFEDIGLAVPSLIFPLEELRKQWDAGRGNVADQSSARQALVQIVRLLTAAKKSRVISDLKSTYFKPNALPYLVKNPAWAEFYQPDPPVAGLAAPYYKYLSSVSPGDLEHHCNDTANH